MTSTARFCFNVWKIFSLLCYEHDNILSVSLYLFDMARIPDYVICSDASPSVVGAAIYNSYCKLLLHSYFKLLFLSPHGCDSDFQNAREYLGYFFGIFLLQH
jgi:hypothetical protein